MITNDESPSLDSLQALWATQNDRLERSLALNELLIQRQVLNASRLRLRRHVRFRSLELGGCVLAIGFLGSVLFEHWMDPRAAAAAATLQLFLTGLSGLIIHQLVLLRGLGYDGPVATIQRRLEEVRASDYRTFKFSLLGGILLWSLVPIVFLCTLGGPTLLDHVSGPWLLLNLLFGVVVLALGQFLSARYLESESASPRARKWMETLSGTDLRRARDFLQDVQRFESSEDPPA